MTEGTDISLFILRCIMFGLIVLIVISSGVSLQASISDGSSCAFEFAGGGEGECGSEMDLELPDGGAEPDYEVVQMDYLEESGLDPVYQNSRDYTEEMITEYTLKNMRQKLAEDGIDVETSAVGVVLNYKWQTIRDEKGMERLLNRTESRPYFEYNIYDENDNIIKQYTLGDKENAKVRLISDPRQLPKGNKYIAKDGWQLSEWDNPNSGRQSTLYLLEGEDDGYIYSFGVTEQGHREYPLDDILGNRILENPNS